MTCMGRLASTSGRTHRLTCACHAVLLQIVVQTNGKPVAGNLTVEPWEGTALSTVFDIEVRSKGGRGSRRPGATSL